MSVCSTVCVDHTTIWVSYKYRLTERILAHLTDLFVRKKNWGSFLLNLKRGEKKNPNMNLARKEGKPRHIISAVPNGQNWSMIEVKEKTA